MRYGDSRIGYRKNGKDERLNRSDNDAHYDPDAGNDQMKDLGELF